MKRLIILSWTCILFGCVLITFQLLGEATRLTMVFYVLGNMLLFAPNIIWLIASNKITSVALNQPPSKLATVLTAICTIAFVLTFGYIGAQFFMPVTLSSSPLMEALIGFVFFAWFTALIAASVFVSHRIIDTQENPDSGRGSRVFVLTICFFYIAIGMFFIARKLKNMRRLKEIR
jgi:hypothetical protein